MTPLTTLCTNQRGVVEMIAADNEHTMRLLALGFTPGTEVSVCNGSIFGSPRVFTVQGSRIALRDFDAGLIHVSVN